MVLNMYDNLHDNMVLASYDSFAGDAFIPEIWAAESLALLEGNSVMASLVHRDFSQEVARFGHTVHTRRPRPFKFRRKDRCEAITCQDPESDDVEVKMDQHIYVSFLICDDEQTCSFQDLVAYYLVPAVQAISEGLDRAILGCLATADVDSVGRLGGMNGDTAKGILIAASKCLDQKNAYTDGRNLVVGPCTHAGMLENELFLCADCTGDEGALRRATLGNLFGFSIFMDQHVNSVEESMADTVVGALGTTIPKNTPAGTVLDVSVTGHEVQPGEFVVIKGHDRPLQVTAATTGAGDTTDITVDGVIDVEVVAPAEVVVYVAGAITNAYADCYAKNIEVTSGAAPQKGQIVSINGNLYSIVEVDDLTGGSYDLWLNKRISGAITAADQIAFGPAGEINVAFHRDGVALVTRPLALPKVSGVTSGIMVHNDLAMRVTMAYDHNQEGVKITLALLAGIAVLDPNLICRVYG